MDSHGIFYIDMFFLTEWLMNSMVLCIYCCLTGRKITGRKNLGISLLTTGCSVAFFCLLCRLRWWNRGWAAALTVFCAGLELALLQPRKEKKLWKNTLLELPSLFLSSFLLAGSLLAIISGGGRQSRECSVQKPVLKQNGIGGTVVGKVMITGFVTGMICIFLTVRSWRKTAGDSRKRKVVRISLEGRTYTVTAITDTGNHLYEKGSGYPVHIIEESCLFTAEEKERLMQEKPERFRWIPYASLGNPAGLLLVLRVDQMCIEDGRQTVTLKDQQIGLTSQRLNQGEEWRMLLHPDLKNGSNSDEPDYYI